MMRGEIFSAAMPGETGKPRQVILIQDDAFAQTLTVIVVPLTSTQSEGMPMRVAIEPNAQSGLRVPSWAMVPRTAAIGRDKIGTRIGHISDATLLEIERALLVVLGIRQ